MGRNKKSKPEVAVPVTCTGSLQSVCENCETLKPFFYPGLGALKKGEKKQIIVPDTTLFGISVNLDDAAKAEHAKENRWDYAIEYDCRTYFIEIHPGYTSEVDTMIKKVKFLISWLKTHVPAILNLPGPGKFYWVSSGKTDLRFSPNSIQARKLAINKIESTGNKWDIVRISQQ